MMNASLGQGESWGQRTPPPTTRPSRPLYFGGAATGASNVTSTDTFLPTSTVGVLVRIRPTSRGVFDVS
jgi:hypothetical protein